MKTIGRRFGELVVVAMAPTGSTRHARWVCRCDCGRMYIVRGALLRDGTTTRCKHCAVAAAVETRRRPRRKRRKSPDAFTLAVYNLAVNGDAKGVMDAAHRRLLESASR